MPLLPGRAASLEPFWVGQQDAEWVGGIRGGGGHEIGQERCDVGRHKVYLLC